MFQLNLIMVNNTSAEEVLTKENTDYFFNNWMIRRRFSMNLYIGTYTHNSSKGIYRMKFNEEYKSFTTPELVAELESPTYLYLTKDQRRLYAVSETISGKYGEISAYQIINDKLQLFNKVSAPCGGLVHLTLDKKERFLFAVNYSDGYILMYPIDNDGSILELCCEIIHSGKVLNPMRQEKAHAHFVCLTPDEKFLCVCDLGLDLLAIYQVDYDNNNLLKREDLNIQFPLGCGPRHMVFHPNGKYTYVLTELSSEVFVLEYDKDSGFNIIQSQSTLMNSDSESYAAAIRISNDGKYLYTSNRGDDSIAIFKINEDGTVSLNSIVSTHGKHPRDFILYDNDQMLLCANRDTDNIIMFSRDMNTGLINFKEEITGISMPVSLLVSEITL